MTRAPAEAGGGAIHTGVVHQGVRTLFFKIDGGLERLVHHMPTLLWHLALLATASASLVISEVADKGAADACDGEEWIELHNAGDAAAELAGLILHDDKGVSDEDALALGGSLGAGEYLLLCRKADFEFKIGGGDTAPRGCSSTTRTRRTT